MAVSELPSLISIREKVHHWMFNQAMPVWISQGILPEHGGPIEAFSNLPRPTPLKTAMRSRVSGRQLYVFSHAHILGVPGSIEAAETIFNFLCDRIWLGPDRGWTKTLTPDGTALDQTIDLYDLSFCLFGLAWYYEASKNETAHSLILQTLDLLEKDFRHPSGLGFHNSLPISLPRQQNPHMHLMEALLKLNSVIPSPRLSGLTSELADLFSTHFYNTEMNCLPEYFSDDLSPKLEENGYIRIEPGHKFEWAWILAQHQRQSGRDQSELVSKLVSSSETYGVCRRTNLTFNAIDSSGAVLDASSRTWPNTERIKGWIGLYEVTGAPPWEKITESVEALFAHHLGKDAVPGMWLDEFSSDGRVISNTIPASTLYHIWLAFSEVLRVLPDH